MVIFESYYIETEWEVRSKQRKKGSFTHLGNVKITRMAGVKQISEKMMGLNKSLGRNQIT